MQQINLYTAQYPVKEKIKVSGKLSAIIILFFIVSIAGTSIFYWKIEALRKEYTEFKKSSTVAQDALNKVKSRLDESAADDKLKIDLLNIKEQLKHKEELKKQLNQQSTDISASFYKRFVALSNQDIKGLWLREIEFANKGNKITLSGTARNAGLFTQYLQKLSNETVFTGVTFTVLHLDTGEEGSQRNTINFVISTDELPNETPLDATSEKGTPLQTALKKFSL